jgi:hypothetical protein
MPPIVYKVLLQREVHVPGDHFPSPLQVADCNVL